MGFGGLRASQSDAWVSFPHVSRGSIGARLSTDSTYPCQQERGQGLTSRRDAKQNDSAATKHRLKAATSRHSESTNPVTRGFAERFPDPQHPRVGRGSRGTLLRSPFSSATPLSPPPRFAMPGWGQHPALHHPPLLLSQTPLEEEIKQNKAKLPSPPHLACSLPLPAQPTPQARLQGGMSAAAGGGEGGATHDATPVGGPRTQRKPRGSPMQPAGPCTPELPALPSPPHPRPHAWAP